MIYFQSPFFPPSYNNSYFTIIVTSKGGNGRGHKVPKQVLTDEGRKFKREFKTWLAKNHHDVLRFFDSSPSGEYEVLTKLYFKKVYNAGWPIKAATRHTKVDVTNRVKILEDAIVEACGHDDSQHFSFSVTKAAAPSDVEPFFELWAWNTGIEHGPISAFLFNLKCIG